MCGIIGIVGTDKIVDYLLRGLIELERRGHQGAGFNFLIEKDAYLTRKGDGMPADVIPPDSVDGLEARIKSDVIKTAIAHVRYRTAGGEEHARQPIILNDMAVVHNGNIFGYKDMAQSLNQREIQPERSDSDTQLLAKLIASSSQQTLEEAITETIDITTPTMNFIVQQRDNLYVYKDPTNSHPLSIGRIDKQGWAVASEQSALNEIGATQIKDVKPGEFLVLQKGLKSSMRLYKPWEHRCIFEEIYVAMAQKMDSDYRPKLWGRDLTQNRIIAGARLWNHFYQRKNLENCIVAYAPDSARWAAMGFSEASGIPLSDAIQAKTLLRGFLQGTQQKRESMAKRKYEYEREQLCGKRAYFIEDSTVRGTTLWEMVKQLRLHGVNELNVGIASSKIHSPCYYGMDFPTYRELLASHLNKRQVELFYTARFLGYDDSKKKLIRLIKEGKGIKDILEHNENYLSRPRNKHKSYDPDNFDPDRFSLHYLTQKEMEQTYGDKRHYCQACFTGKHWIEEWYKVKDDLRIKNRRWKYERITARGFC